MTQILKPMAREHFSDLFRFEMENRDWFEQWVPPRPDGYQNFETFCDICNDFIEASKAGRDAFYLGYDDDQLIGRFNLTDINQNSAHIGYRLAFAHTGRGYATAFTQQLITEARSLGIQNLIAQVALENEASIHVLKRLGFSENESSLEPVMVGHQRMHLKRFDLAVD